MYKTTCFACHQLHGKGLANVAPPLVNSDWLKGSDEKAIKVALHGLSGPIKVNGKDYKNLPVMPGHAAAYNNRQIAAVLTYIKNTWGNKGKEVGIDSVKKIRKKNKNRSLPWTAKELSGIK